jgi:protein-L-isoaspartate(D-aspartate) O-methyltransferase
MNYDSSQQALITTLKRDGIHHQAVLDAIADTPRERFLPETVRNRAYENSALPISDGQTISQPYIVALMTQALELTGREKVLEIGTGSGYQAAILAQLCREVVTIERIANLSRHAQVVLDSLGYDNIDYHVADGTLGYPGAAPYDGILVTATAPKLPAALCEQLTLGGRMVIPIGEGNVQELKCITRRTEGLRVEKLCDVRFVPLIGEQGWRDEETPGEAGG